MLEDRVIGNIAKIQRLLDLPPRKFCELLLVNPQEYKKVLQGEKLFTATNLHSFCLRMGITLDALMGRESLDYKALTKQFHNELALPEKYEGLQHSRARCIQSILYHASLIKGDHYGSLLLRRMQLKPIHFQNGDALISSNIIRDMLDLLKQDGFDPEYIKVMGTSALALNPKSATWKFLKSHKTPQHMYETIYPQANTHFDTAFQYILQTLNNHSCTIKITNREESQDLNHTTLIGSRDVCLFRQGTIASMTEITFAYRTKITETQCTYLGDPSCVYHIHWDQPRHIKKNHIIFN